MHGPVLDEVEESGPGYNRASEIGKFSKAEEFWEEVLKWSEQTGWRNGGGAAAKSFS